MNDADDNIDWSKTTWEGSRREQLRRWRALSLRERLLAVEEMAELSARFGELRAQRELHSINTGSEGSVGVNRGYINEVREPQAEYKADRMSNEIVLAGCTPTPLANYLKALGVLRLLTARDPKVKGAWRGEVFVLQTALAREEVELFFLEGYAPTPLVAPWGARSGFYDGSSEKTAREALARIAASDKAQLAPFRSMIESVRDLLKRNRITEKASDEKKTELLRICRAELPDDLLEWLDACYVISSDDRQFPPLLGTGGNEGSGSYVSGFAQLIVSCIAERKHDAALTAALFGTVMPGIAEDQTPGHFSPVHGGGANSSTGFKDERASTNPWDYILALEGTLAFAGAVVRRSANDPSGVLSYPFTVQAVSAGAGSLAEGDMRKKPRGELWLPLWERPSSYTEVRALTTEGRVALGRRPAKDALDFVRAIHHLGGYRGVQSFQRFGLLNRKGDSYFATPLSRIEVNTSPQTNLLDELDKGGWLDKFRRFAQGENVSNKVQSLRGQLETAFFRLSGKTPTPTEVQSVLVLLGEIQGVLSVSKKAQEAKVHEIPRLSECWVHMADDKTPAFRIACAQAGVRDKKSDKPHSPAGARLDDVLAFLRDDAMDSRIASLLPGLSLCEIPLDIEHETGEGAVPAAFALLKLCLTPEATLCKLGFLGEDERIRVPPGMLAQLAAGNANNQAVQAAWRRLRASGLSPAFDIKALPTLDGLSARRVATALQIPLRFGATAALARSVLKQPEPQPETA